MSVERVTVRALSEGVVQFTGCSGAIWSAPSELCVRSSLFAQLFEDGRDDLHPPAEAPKLVRCQRCVSDQDATQEDTTHAQGLVLNVPVGYLEAWMQLLNWDEEKKLECEPSTAALHMQAADFFGDEQALHAASHALALHLPTTAAGHDGATTHAAAQQAPVETSPAAACSSAPALQEVLDALPSHLVDLVFASQATPLSRKLASLPQAWHEQIVEAHLRFVTRNTSLSLHGVHEGRWLPNHVYSSLFSSMQSLTSLRELSIDFFLLRGACRQPDLFKLLTEAVSGLRSLRALRLRRVSEQVPNLNSSELWQAVCRLTALTAFEVTDSELHSECARQITAAIFCLTNLERLVIRPPASMAARYRLWVRSLPRRCEDPLLQTCISAQLLAALQQMSQLTHLDLHGYGALWRRNVNAAPHPLDLAHLQHLRHLDLSDLCREFPSLRSEHLNLSGCSGLQHLDLSHRVVDATSLTDSLPAFSALTHLSLHLAVERGGQEGTVAPLPAVCALQCAKLSTLQLEFDRGSERLAAVRSSMATLTALTCLQIYSETCGRWSSMLTAFVSLERLDVYNEWVGDLDPLCASVQNVPQLKSLTLECVIPELARSSQHCTDFVAAMARLSQLTYLHLDTQVPWDGGPFSALAAGLSSLNSLQELYIVGQVLWMSAADILPAVSALPHLRVLDIPMTGARFAQGGIDAEFEAEAPALAAALKSSPSSLEYLDVSDVLAESPEIVDALSLHTALTYLSCDVDHEDPLQLLKGVLQALPNLQEAYFSRPNELLPAEDDICDLMLHHKCLDVLELGETRFDCLGGSLKPL